MSFTLHADFEIKSSSLKEIRNFCRKIFQKNQDLENEQEKLILVISEAAQNIIKHAYENKDSSDKMRLQISYNNNELQIDLYDKGKLVIEEDVKPRDLDDIKAGGLGTTLIKNAVDEMYFSKNIEKGNCLNLIKKIT